MANTPQSRKAKGRRLQQAVRDMVLDAFPELEDEDLRSTSMGASGEDLLPSPLCRKKFPFAVECKNQERINIWSSYQQAVENSGDHVPLLCYKRNRSDIMCTLRFSDLLELLK